MSLVLLDPTFTWKTLAKLSFWFGVFLIAIGSVITILPGAGVGLATFIAVFLLPGFALSRGYRVATIALLALLLVCGWSDYQRGKAYQSRLQQRQAEDALIGD
ncbi:MAG TPA: hypothetical protein VIK18_01720 [Pirellulales bacterium]